MKKYILGIVIAGLLLAPIAMTNLAAAADFPPTGTMTTPSKGISSTSVIATLGNVADWIFYILLAVSVVLIAIAGLQYATAQGDPDKIKEAGTKVLYALIGIIVAALAKGLVVLVQYFPKQG